MTPPWKHDSEFDRPCGELVLRRISPQPRQDDRDDHMHSGGNGAPTLLLTYPSRRAVETAITRGPPSITITAPELMVNATLVVPKAPGIWFCPEVQRPTLARGAEVAAARSFVHAPSDFLALPQYSHTVSLLMELKCSLSAVLAREERGYEPLCSNVPGMDEVVPTPGNSIIGSPTCDDLESCSKISRRLLNPGTPGDICYSGKYNRAWMTKRASASLPSPPLLCQDCPSSSQGLSSGTSPNPSAKAITGPVGEGEGWEFLSTPVMDHVQTSDTECEIDCAADSSLPGTPRSCATLDSEEVPLVPGSPLESTLENWYKNYNSRGLGLCEETEEEESDDDFLYMAPTKILKQKFERRNPNAPPPQTTGLIRELLAQAPGVDQQQESSSHQNEPSDGTTEQENTDAQERGTGNNSLPDQRGQQPIYAFRTGPVGYYNGAEITIPMVRDPQLLAGLMGDEADGLAGDVGPLGRRPMGIFEMTRSQRMFERQVSEMHLRGS